MNVLDSICRLCCEKSTDMFGIFDEFGIGNAVSEKITNRLHIVVNKNDVLPTSICIVCYARLDKFDAFVRDVHKTQTRLLEFVANEIKRLSSIETNEIQCQEQETNFSDDDTVISVSDESDFDDLVIIDNEKEHEEKSNKDFQIVQSMVPKLSQPYSGNLANGSAQRAIETLQSSLPGDERNDLRMKFIISDQQNVKIARSDTYNSSVQVRLQAEHQNRTLSSRTKDVECQVGNSLSFDLATIEDELRKKNPAFNINNMLVVASSLNTVDDPAVPYISSDSVTTKGCQVTIALSLKQRPHAMWSPEQKKFMRQYFQHYFASNSVPSLNDCAQLITGVNALFHNKTGTQIRQYFSNRRHRLSRDRADRKQAQDSFQVIRGKK